MKIISFSFTEISAHRKETPKNKMEIKTNLAIEDIKKEEVDFDQKKALKFDFSYTINFEPSIANIILKGNIIALDEAGDSDSILKDWKKKQFTSPIKTAMFNLILNKCNVRAVDLEEELNLPFHVPFPQINPDGSNKSAPSELSKKPVNYTG